jgi:hypothetical protein
MLRHTGRLAVGSLLVLMCRVIVLWTHLVDFHVFDLSGNVGADVSSVDPTAPLYSGLDESQLFRKH